MPKATEYKEREPGSALIDQILGTHFSSPMNPDPSSRFYEDLDDLSKAQPLFALVPRPMQVRPQIPSAQEYLTIKPLINENGKMATVQLETDPVRIQEAVTFEGKIPRDKLTSLGKRSNPLQEQVKKVRFDDLNPDVIDIAVSKFQPSEKMLKMKPKFIQAVREGRISDPREKMMRKAPGFEPKDFNDLLYKWAHEALSSDIPVSEGRYAI